MPIYDSFPRSILRHPTPLLSSCLRSKDRKDLQLSATARAPHARSCADICCPRCAFDCLFPLWGSAGAFFIHSRASCKDSYDLPGGRLGWTWSHRGVPGWCSASFGPHACRPCSTPALPPRCEWALPQKKIFGIMMLVGSCGSCSVFAGLGVLVQLVLPRETPTQRSMRSEIRDASNVTPTCASHMCLPHVPPTCASHMCKQDAKGKTAEETDPAESHGT